MPDSHFRNLPSVHELAGRLQSRFPGIPETLLIRETQRALDAARDRLRQGGGPPSDLEQRVEAALAACSRKSLVPIINATGVVLHTNLGRAPLAAFDPLPGYSNLEYDLATGKRGKRDVHVSTLLNQILGVPGIVVNNGAAALFLTLNEIAAGGEAIVSRGELIEIGDGFRIPEIMQRSGTALQEVGTTNRTRIDDYRRAINDRTRILLRVHPSNFRITGFTARPDLRDLVALGKEKGIPVYEDLGSGCLVDLHQASIDEPLVQDSLRTGVDLVSFSGDKLLGGPQAGIIAGRADLVARIRGNPLFRAFRQDKLVYQALETTLRHILLNQFDEVPALRMIRMTAEAIRKKAEALAARIPVQTRIEAGESVIGGGSTPGQSLPTYLLVIENENADALERKLRLGNPPIISRIERDRVVLDLRTVFPSEEDAIVQALS